LKRNYGEQTEFELKLILSPELK